MSCKLDLAAQRSSGVTSCSGRAIGADKLVRHILFDSTSRRQRLRGCSVTAFLPDIQTTRTRTVKVVRETCQSAQCLPWLASTVSAIELASMLTPLPSLAGEALPVEFLSSFLDNVEHLGPYGPLFYVGVMIGAEMVPLFPTQPLTIASGLLFGGPKGALLAVVSTSSAAMLAFQLSRRLGEKMAEKAAAEEISEEQRQSGIFSRVQNAIESGSFQQQVVAVTLLRLTPVVPFSATNYLLGATPLQFPAYITGSLVGLTFWCSIYATLGAAGRELLKGGLGLDVLFDELLSRAGSYTEDAAIIMGAVGICVLLYVKFAPQPSCEGDKHDEHKEKRI